LSFDRQNGDAESLQCLEDWVHSPGFDRVRSDFDSHFNQQMECLFALLDRAKVGENEISTLVEWSRDVESLRSITGDSLASLEQTLADVPLLLKIIENTLSTIASSSELTNEVVESIGRLSQDETTIPVLPAHGCSLVESDYVLNTDSPSILESVVGCHSTLGQWDDDTLDALMDAGEQAGVEDECDVAFLAECRDHLSALLQFFIQGWPVDRARLKSQSHDLLGLLEKWPTEASDLLSSRSQMMERLEHIMSVEPTAVTPVLPSGDRNRQVQIVPSRKMREVANWLAIQTCPRSKRYLNDVRSLSTTLGQSLGRDAPRIGKDIVNMLIGIDAITANSDPDSDTETLSGLGDRLRKILVNDFGYRVLGFDDLIGRSIHSLEGKAKLHKTVAVPNHASDEVVGLHTPGYLFEYETGRVDVVKSAEVIVSE
jgi:hypothetical protein